jgi:hypothetical protein
VASKNATIEKIFNSALSAWSTAQSIPVAWDGKAYNPVVPSKYVSQVLVPARPQNVAIGKDVTQRREGVYQIDVYASTENAKYDADVIIASLESTFKVGYPLTYSGVSAQVTNFFPDPHGIDEGWYRVSISIYYRAEI